MAAAAVVSVSMGVMKPVLAKLATLMGDEYKKIKGLQKEAAFLQRELSDMDALLEKMDMADELDLQAKIWRKDIIEMSYDIEDLIDVFMHPVGEADDKMGIIQKASRYLTTFKDRHCLVNQLQDIKTRVMEASERRKRYMLDGCISITTPAVVDPRLSALYKESASLVGIKTQKDKIVKWATEERQELKVMAIVGLGGLGKTTLANEVYREIGGQFDLKAFVSVSQNPEMTGLFNSLLSQIGLGTYPHPYQMQDLISNIRRHLQDKKYLVLVDDLRDIRAWNTISCAFPQNSQQCRVVITTRIKGVAIAACGKHGFIHMMKPLSEPDSRKLFLDRIFGSEDACPSELARASDKILTKCGGLPLAIITIASMLACQPQRLEGQWEYIQNSLATKVTTNSSYEDMMYILDLSYRNLPRHLKACFLYLGSYPEDHQYRRVEVVRRWVEEGFVGGSNGQDVWDIAESYFYELVNRSMIQPWYMWYFIELDRCRVHDMILELIMRRCEEDNFLTLLNDTKPMEEVQGKVIRRLTVVSRSTDDGKAVVTASAPGGGNLSKIRCLSVFQEYNWLPPLLDFKSVRVLTLQLFNNNGAKTDLTGINLLSQLRYLRVQGYRECMVLPSQIKGLQLLQTLDLSSIFDGGVKLEVVDVPCMSHFIMPRHTRLPDLIGKVKSLKSLHGFSLPAGSLKSIIGLGELTALTNLSLHVPEGCGPLPKTTWMATLSSSLEKLHNLRQLNLMASGGYVAWCADVLSLLSQPFHNLKRLDLDEGCTFSRFPRWIVHLQNLCVLRLGVKQILEEDIAIIGTRLPSLLELGLRIAGALTESIVIRVSMGFPLLEIFRFDYDRISYLTFEVGAVPKLKVLELFFNIDEWDKATPGGLQHLKTLEDIIVQQATWGDAKICDLNEAYKLIWGVFQESALGLLFVFKGGSKRRPIEEYC